MKIEVGKTYKSNIRAFTKPGGAYVPEVWTIQTSYFCDIRGKTMFLGRRLGVDNVIVVREFDESGVNGATKTGNDRQLLPNTKTVIEWGVVKTASGAFFSNRASFKPNTKEGTLARLEHVVEKGWDVGFVTYEVEEP